MTLTAIIGALVALLPPALLQPKDKDSEAEKLARANARLIDHIQSLERELLTERHLTQTRIEEIETLNRDLAVQRDLARHWRGETMRVAERARENRDAAEKAQTALARHVRSNPYDGRQALAWAQQNALQNAQTQIAQLNQLTQLNQLNQLTQQAQQGAFDGFCNCVPSRAQVWAEEENSLVQRLNNRSE